jgi:protein phosphatase
MSPERAPSEAFDGFAIDVAGETAAGRLHLANRDRWWARSDGRCAVVADGMGDTEAADHAAALAVATLSEVAAAIPAAATPETWTRALTRAILAADARLRVRDAADRRHSSGGTTVAAAALSVVDGKTRPSLAVVVAHSGDSRCLLVRGGQVFTLTADHSMAAELIASGQIDERSELARRTRNVLTHFVGSGDPSPRTKASRLMATDRVVLCTDGLTRQLELATIGSIVGSMAAGPAAAELIARADAAGGRDNATAIVMAITPRTVPDF